MLLNKTNSFVLILMFIVSIGCSPNSANKEKNEYKISTNESITDKVQTTETYNQIGNEEINNLNRQIRSKSLSNAQDIIRLYKPEENPDEGKYSYTIHSNKIDEQTTEYTLIESGLLDDSVEAIKSIITIEKIDNQLQVVSIKENYRCYRGHKDWSAKICN